MVKLVVASSSSSSSVGNSNNNNNNSNHNKRTLSRHHRARSNNMVLRSSSSGNRSTSNSRRSSSRNNNSASSSRGGGRQDANNNSSIGGPSSSSSSIITGWMKMLLLFLSTGTIVIIGWMHSRYRVEEGGTLPHMVVGDANTSKKNGGGQQQDGTRTTTTTTLAVWSSSSTSTSSSSSSSSSQQHEEPGTYEHLILWMNNNNVDKEEQEDHYDHSSSETNEKTMSTEKLQKKKKKLTKSDQTPSSPVRRRRQEEQQHDDAKTPSLETTITATTDDEEYNRFDRNKDHYIDDDEMVEAVRWTVDYLSLMKNNSSSEQQQEVDDNNVMKVVEHLPYKGYRSQEEMDERINRFPSVEKRVRTYMSNWYVPPCRSSNHNSLLQLEWRNSTGELAGMLPHFIVKALPKPAWKQRRYFRVHGEIQLNHIFYLRRDQYMDCNYTYCNATIQTIFPALDRLAAAGEDYEDDYPLILQYGDSEPIHGFNMETQDDYLYPNIPIIKKFRYAYTPHQIDLMTTEKVCNDVKQFVTHHAGGGERRWQPIIWKMKFQRHFGMLNNIPKFDIPWWKKQNVAVFRGGVTGVHSGSLEEEKINNYTDYEICQLIPRCRLVYNYHNSTFVDSLFTDDRITIPEQINNISMYGERMFYRELLQHKAIIMPEGNDVSTGLKWALFSNSVVMTTIPTKTAWAMEELLIPWVHYIPLNNNFTDVEEKMIWIINNDAKAKEIAMAGSLWIRDLVFHPNAQQDENNIFDDIIRRFRKHFELAPVNIPNETDVVTTAKMKVAARKAREQKEKERQQREIERQQREKQRQQREIERQQREKQRQQQAAERAPKNKS